MKRIWIPQIIAIVMLLWALNPDNPYGYYTFLRLVCFAVFAYLAFMAFKLGLHDGWVWLSAIAAIVYNPIIRVHFTREIWSIINVFTIGIAIVSIFVFKLKQQE